MLKRHVLIWSRYNKISFHCFIKGILLENVHFYFWLHWVFLSEYGLSLVAGSEGYSPACGMWVSQCCGAQAVGCAGFSSCCCWAPLLQLADSWAQVQELWGMGSVSRQHMASSRTRDQRQGSPCIASRFLTTGPPGKPHEGLS